MPYVKKSEYERLKGIEKVNLIIKAEFRTVNKNSLYYQERLSETQQKLANVTETCALRKQDNYLLSKAYDSLDWEVKRWKRYYNAAIKTFKIQEYVEMPGCFNPMESIEYIAKRQADEHERLEKEVQNRQAC